MLVTTRMRFIGVGAIGASAALTSVLVGAPRRTTDVIVLGAALAFGYVIDLRPTDRLPVPVGFAVAVVLVRAASLSEFLLVIAATTILGVAVRSDLTGPKERVLAWAGVAAAGVGCGLVFHGVSETGGRENGAPTLLITLGTAAIFELVVFDVIGVCRGEKLAPWRARGADLAIVSSGVLMSVGYAGISNKGSLGLWGPALFSVPLLAAWYSFELGDRTRRTFRQTVEALGVAPELGKLAPPGHVEHVARLSVAIARQLGVGEGHVADLETAAWLHHLGAVSLEVPDAGQPLDPAEVSRAGSEMLRASRTLGEAGDIIAAELEPDLARGQGADDLALSMGQILRVASAYDELTQGDETRSSAALAELLASKAAGFDSGALTALEHVLQATPYP